MGNLLYRITGLLVLSVIVYNVLLIGSGRGPFALYEDHWSCHCSDLYVSEPPEDPFANLGVELEILSGSYRSQPSANQVNTDEMCLDTIALEEEAAAGDVCKRKLPLRYLSLLLGNALMLQAEEGHTFIKPDIILSYELTPADYALQDGFPVPHKRPPILT